MSGIYDPINQRLVYPSWSNRKTFRDGDLVVSINPERLNAAWKTKMEAILSIVDIPLFHSFIEDGYTTRYIDCVDLYGNIPFSADISVTTILNEYQKSKVSNIFNNLIYVGETLGYTFGDVTCSNLLLKDDNIYIVDYDPIVDYPLDKAFRYTWDNTLRLVFGDNK